MCSADQLQWSLCLINVSQCDNLNSVIIDQIPLNITVSTAVCGCNGRGYCFTTVDEDGSWMHNCNCSSPYYGERCQYGKTKCLRDKHHPVTVTIMCLLSMDPGCRVQRSVPVHLLLLRLLQPVHWRWMCLL